MVMENRIGAEGSAASRQQLAVVYDIKRQGSESWRRFLGPS